MTQRSKGNKNPSKNIDSSRSSYLQDAGSINGLRSQPATRRTTTPKHPGAAAAFDSDTVLAGQITALRQVVSQENETKDKLVEMLTQRCSRAEAKVDELQLEMARVERVMESARHNIVKVEQERDTYGKEAEDAAQQLDIISEDLVYERSQVDDKTKEIQKLNAQISQLVQKSSETEETLRYSNNKLQQQIQQLTEQLHVVNTELEHHKRWIQNTEMHSNQVNAELNQARNQYSQLYNQHETLQHVAEKDRNTMSHLKDQYHKLRKAFEANRDKQSNCDATIVAMRRREQSLQDELKQVVENSSGTQEQRMEYLAKISRLQKQNEQRDKRNNVLQNKLERIEKQLEESESKNSQTQQEFEKLKEKHKILKQRYTYLEESYKEEQVRNSTGHISNSSMSDARVEQDYMYANNNKRTAGSNSTFLQAATNTLVDKTMHQNQPNSTRVDNVKDVVNKTIQAANANEGARSSRETLYETNVSKMKKTLVNTKSTELGTGKNRKSSRVPLPRRRNSNNSAESISTTNIESRIKKIPDPSIAPDSDAPDWVKF